jgi:hypothetical protein
MLAPTGEAPSVRWDHAAAADPTRDRIVIFGGQGEVETLDDVWEFTMAGSGSWTRIITTGTSPSPRASHTAIHDIAGDRLVVFGGYDGVGFLSDVWALSLSGSPSWTQIIASGPVPIARRDHVAVYDPIRRRMIVQGGYGGEGFLNDTWALSLDGDPSWAEMSPPGLRPAGAITHAGIYDPVRDQLVVFGGSYHNETWALSLDASPQWSRIAEDDPLPPGRIDHVTVFDPARDRMVVFGGHTGLTALQDSWALEFSGTADAGDRREDRPATRAVVVPNPTAGGVRISFHLPRGGNFQLRVHDATGRIVHQTERPALQGANVVWWDGHTVDRAPAAAGLYFVAIETRDAARAHRVTGRFLIVR